MPIPALAVAGIAAGAQLVGTGVNAYAQGKTNKKSREFTREMYFQQLSDNKNNWDIQNAYNHPKEQMNRLSEAGLNPALMYGGSGGGGGSASPISAASPRTSYATPPQIDTGAAANTFQNYMTAQNFELQKKVVAAEIALKTNQSIKTLTEAEATAIDNKTREEINLKRAILLGYQGGESYMKNNLLNEQILQTQANTAKILSDTEIAQYMKEPNKQRVIAEIAYKTAQASSIPIQQQNLQSMIHSRTFENNKKEFDL
jgi:hypothetical protein